MNLTLPLEPDLEYLFGNTWRRRTVLLGVIDSKNCDIGEARVAYAFICKTGEETNTVGLAVLPTLGLVLFLVHHSLDKDHFTDIESRAFGMRPRSFETCITTLLDAFFVDLGDRSFVMAIPEGVAFRTSLERCRFLDDVGVSNRGNVVFSIQGELVAKGQEASSNRVLGIVGNVCTRQWSSRSGGRSR